MRISFIIISNGNKKQKVDRQIMSIHDLRIPEYEIIVAGIYHEVLHPNVHYVEDKRNAERGSLGGLRNSACNITKYENVVVSDDDMLFPSDWYNNILQSPEFDILTTRILNPDGTRFWDHACYMSPRGHMILNPDEDDDHLYMSGGQSWVMKKYVWDKIKWNSELLFYNMKNLNDYAKGVQNEDTDFAYRCRESGFKIIHDHNVVVHHDDPSYTSIGRIVRRRRIYNTYEWVKDFNFPDKIAIDFAINLIQNGLEAEGADILRKLSISRNFQAMQLFMDLENVYGGKLVDSNFSL